jgi:hypothetical protein
MIHILKQRLLRSAVAILLVLQGVAYAADDAARAALDTPVGMSQDFDAQHGRWHTTVRRLVKPLQGSREWTEYDGTTVVHPMLGGRANIAELDASGPLGRIQGVSIRLFEPSARRWSIHFVNLASGILDDGITGGFAGGSHGVFYGRDTWDGRPIVVRFVIDVIDAQTVHFEQAFSANAGADWEVNWIAVDKRL